jgi:hypothetical protein
MVVKIRLYWTLSIKSSIGRETEFLVILMHYHFGIFIL